MKPFDLTKPVQTKNGLDVRILCTDADNVYPVIGLIKPRQGREKLAQWTEDGSFLKGLMNNDYDLVNVPTKHSGFVNVYRKSNGEAEVSAFHPTSASAAEGRERSLRAAASSTYITTLSLEWEE
jgi:hypothetical protein